MKFHLLLIIAISISSICFSFKSSHILIDSSLGSQNVSDTKTKKYRLIVSFISVGTGTDANKRLAFVNYIESHSKKPAYTPVFWGREGETDYCFTLKELSKAEQKAFVSEVKKIIGTSSLVIITENAACIHNSRGKQL